jgi:hypothetical protein
VGGDGEKRVRRGEFEEMKATEKKNEGRQEGWEVWVILWLKKEG